jgi:hypothetical protein
VTDDPRTWGMPQPKLQWEVYPVDKKGRACGAPVYVAAANHERALACGKYWRRVLSMKPAKHVVARRYFPQHDPSMALWVTKTPNPDIRLPRP